MRPAGQLRRIAAGAALWGIATAVCNVLVFRTPLRVGVSLLQVHVGIGVRGVCLVPPSWVSAYGIMFSPYGDLFFLSSLLIRGPVGLYLIVRRDTRVRELAGALIFMCASFFAFNTCCWAWTGW